MHVCDLTTLYIDSSGGGGVNTYLTEKARYFATRPDVTHTIVVPGKEDACTRLFRSRLYRVKSPRLPWNPIHRVLVRFDRVGRILREERPTIAEVDCAYFLSCAVARALRGQNVPIVGFYHVHLPSLVRGAGKKGLRGSLARAVRQLAWRYERWCVNRCDRVVVASTEIRESLEARGVGPVEQVPLGVNAHLFHPEPVRPPAAGRPTVLLHVGRLSPEKDLHVLLEAFRLLEPREGYRLRIVGEGPLRRKIAAVAARDPRVELVGTRLYGEALARAYAEADVLVNPSPNETFSLSLLEAAAVGLPVVAVARGGPLDLVSQDLGVLARPGDPADLAGKIAGVAVRGTGYGRGRERVVRDYSWERCFERLLAVYRRAQEREEAPAAAPGIVLARRVS